MGELFDVIKCPNCGKEFVRNVSSVYKRSVKGKMEYYCGYTCYRECHNGKYKNNKRTGRRKS